MWHTNFVVEMTNASTNTGTLVGFNDGKTHKVLSQINMALSCNLSFSFCETNEASNYVNIGRFSPGFSTDSLVKYMWLLHEVETVITGIQENSFVIFLDG
ncbi:hypothetical protein PHMEG_00013006 [Phytophthora megakarya]|uniref:Uncharacterized protein n=1 Tax=Phytophthora megakarya TaxID=4795 RepID=A0A225W9I2_9STRA|nr:hypothetical protein PHMEG_00013006 [Phytophthora megakarya]